MIALNAAFFVNASILILAATVFYEHGNHAVATLKDAHNLLSPLLGNVWASHLFAIALIAAGQSSTITGTLAGQIVMEGYLNLRMNPWLRRLITRLLAVVPAALIIIFLGENMVDEMLVFSQVLLSMQLAFAVIPLIHFVSDKKNMGIFAIKPFKRFMSWLVALIIVYLNMKLVLDTASEWMFTSNNLALRIGIISFEVFLALMLVTTTFYPIVLKRKHLEESIHDAKLVANLNEITVLPFNRIALALDYSNKDKTVIQYALQFARENTEFVLIHVVESASAKMIGKDAEDYETRKDKLRLEEYTQLFHQQKRKATAHLGYRNRSLEIKRIVETTQCDLLILGSHGHHGLKDLFFGETINRVRHLVKVPIFVAN
jgi:manganese transport protein